MSTFKKGDIVSPQYSDDAPMIPLLVENVTKRILITNIIKNGTPGKQRMKVVKRFAKKLKSKSFCIDKKTISNLIKQIEYDGKIDSVLFLNYTTTKRCLQDEKCEVLKLWYRTTCVYITYNEVIFLKRKDGKLVTMFKGVKLCG